MIVHNDVTFSFQELPEQLTADVVFVNCNFIQTRFGKSKFSNCMFIACNFTLASFGDSQWERCTFKGSDFINAHFDDSGFLECVAIQGLFAGADLGHCHFGFISTDYCDFLTARIPKEATISPTCRELIGEIVKQSSDRSQVQAFASILKVNREWCWETLISIGMSILETEDVEIIYKALKKHSTLERLLIKFIPKKELAYGA